jgi:hypothetical protein
LLVVISEARKERGTVTGYRKLCRALDALGLDVAERDTILAHLDYHHPDGGPYKWLQEKLK